MPVTILAIPLTVYLPPLYGELGIDLALMGLILLVARFSDVITDPIIGITSDKTLTPIGRRKPWVLAGALPLMAMTYLLLVPPDDAGVAYFVMCVVITYLVMTTIQIPYVSWGAELSGNYNERSSITSTREMFVYMGYLGLFLTMGIAESAFGKGLRDQLSYVAIGVCCITPILAILTTTMVPESKIPVERIQRFSLQQYKDGLRFMMKNGPFLRILIGLTGTIIGTSIDSVVSYFFCQHVLLSESSYNWALIGMMVAAMVSLPGWLKLSKKIGKHKTFVSAIFWYVCFAMLMPLLYFMPSDAAGTGFIVLQTIKGVCAGAIGAMATSMAADAIDIDTLRSGEPRTAFYFSVWGSAQKTAAAFASFIGLTAISLFGFDPTLEPGLTPSEGGNTDFALLGIVLLYTIIPCCFYLATLPWVWSYTLNEERQERMRARLERKLSMKII